MLVYIISRFVTSYLIFLREMNPQKYDQCASQEFLTVGMGVLILKTNSY